MWSTAPRAMSVARRGVTEAIGANVAVAPPLITTHSPDRFVMGGTPLSGS